MLKNLTTKYNLTEKQSHKLDYILKMFNITCTPNELVEELLFIPLNDHTEEMSRNHFALIEVIRNDEYSGQRFEEVASLGVEILIRDLNYESMRSRVKRAILE